MEGGVNAVRTIKRAADFGCEIPIGRRGENCAVCVVFDVSKWVAIYGDGSRPVRGEWIEITGIG